MRLVYKRYETTVALPIEYGALNAGIACAPKSAHTLATHLLIERILTRTLSQRTTICRT